MMMNEKMIQRLREQLLKQRDEILEQVAHVASDREGLEDRAIEALDEGQREDLTRILNRLDKRGREELDETDLALDRIALGAYGICELCRKPIGLKRLKVMPVARLCLKCAQQYEKAQETRQRSRDEIIDAEHLEMYRSLDDEKAPLKPGKHLRDKRVGNIQKA
jgi:RNA polymerase-binding transcription factor